MPAGTSQAFSFPAGVSALGTSGSTSVTIKTAAGSSPTQTFSVSSAQGSYSGNMTYGSCIFNVTSSNLPGVTVGQSITVNPCQINVKTGGVVANGQATTVQILLQLGTVPSAANQATVSIDPATGVVTLNNVSTGTAVTLKVTGV